MDLKGLFGREAARNVPEEARSAHSAVERKKMIGLRSILIHRHFGMDVETIRNILQDKLSALEEEPSRMLSE